MFFVFWGNYTKTVFTTVNLSSVLLQLSVCRLLEQFIWVAIVLIGNLFDDWSSLGSSEVPKPLGGTLCTPRKVLFDALNPVFYYFASPLLASLEEVFDKALADMPQVIEMASPLLLLYDPFAYSFMPVSNEYGYFQPSMEEKRVWSFVILLSYLVLQLVSHLHQNITCANVSDSQALLWICDSTYWAQSIQNFQETHN